MAENTTATPPPAAGISVKGLLGYGAFFTLSFAMTFGGLFVAMRGFNNPFSGIASTADSTAVVIDSTGIVETPKEKTERLSDKALKDFEKQKQKDFEQQVQEKAHEEILKREEEIEELKQQVETLKFAYEENRRRYYDLRASSVSGDSLARLIADLEYEKKNVEKKEETIAELDSVSQRLKEFVAKTQLDTVDNKIPVDSLNTVMAELEQERNERLQKEKHIEALQQQLEVLEAEKQAKRNVKVAQLAKVYDAMKPAEAAAIMKSLDNDLVVGILEKVKQRQAAKILASLPPPRAATLSQMIGSR